MANRFDFQENKWHDLGAKTRLIEKSEKYQPAGYPMKSVPTFFILAAILLTFVLFPSDRIGAVTKPHSVSGGSSNFGCCTGTTGNVNSTGIVDLADLSALVSYLTGGGYVLPCPEEANVNGVGIVDLGDLSALVSYLTGGGYVLPACPFGTVTDIDGNVYKTVTIGTQVWMAENLKVTHYRNAKNLKVIHNPDDAIPNVTDGATWMSLTTGAYCDYNNDVNNAATYGRLYNWYAVTDSRNIAPVGWHVPTDAEWQTLIDYLGGDAVAGGKMKEAGFAHWSSPNTGATNESGFTALPGGSRLGGDYYLLGFDAAYWSSTESGSDNAWWRYLVYDYSDIRRSNGPNKHNGFSVHCVMDDVPILTTTPVSAITQTTAECGGTITSEGVAAVTARGVCWSTNPTPTVTDNITSDGTGTGSFISSITGLTAGTPYYVRAYATNSAGTGYGNIQSFTTLENNTIPLLTTATVSAITWTTAECGGTITSDGGATVTARGVCWSTNPTPTVADNTSTDGTGTGSFTSSITGLTAGTPYYVRAYATNSVGTGYGNIQSFTTASSSGTVTDIDGNVYQTVTIGTQVWMAENLKVTHYRNGDPIPNVTDDATWAGLTTGAYCNYDNDVDNVATYGSLCNWYAVTDSRNIAPVGWHVPTDAEWKQLEMTLGMSQAQADATGWRGTTEGGKLKEAGTTHWNSPNTGATNQSCFSALPGGFRDQAGTYSDIGLSALFWSSTEFSSYYAWYRLLYDVYSDVCRYYVNKEGGFSVRCVKD
jgi:uncharacterized protein (TIGR02145 family)